MVLQNGWVDLMSNMLSNKNMFDTNKNEDKKNEK